MCLITDTEEISVADTDMVAYKWVRENPNGDGLISPFQCVPVGLGTMQSKVELSPHKTLHCKNYLPTDSKLQEPPVLRIGHEYGYHCFTSIKNARKSYLGYIADVYRGFKLVKVIIPAGTNYAYNEDKTEMVSEQIYYTVEVEIRT